ncbi:MAG: pentapeptide repeat-containing protein [Synechococcaceae cyanobacterium RL_1_2]|nr:pentapeptide repeat-containing protein [Synechococcaceae cyanobacterium RL_1_2]
MRYLKAFLIVAIVCIGCWFNQPYAQAASNSVVTALDNGYENEDFSGQDFSDRDLKTYEFNKVLLQDANFSNSDLRGVIFNTSDLTGANLSNIDFRDGLSYLSTFANADLRNSIFSDAMMLRTIFDGAKIEGADFSFAVLEKDQLQKMCAVAEGVNPKTGVATKDSLGCF